MAFLPSAGSENTVGVLITTTADDGAIKTTQAELQVLGDNAKGAGEKAKSGFEQFNSSLKSAGQQMSAVGRDLTTYVSLPIVGVGAAAVKSATDFQQAMTYIRTDAGDTTDNINTLSNAVLDLAQKSQFNADELAKGLYHVASLGLRGADALNALNTAQKMASVGGADLESTATALGGAIVTGIKGVQDYNQAAGELDATIGAGNMRMQDLVSAIGTGVLPVFKNAGLSITDFGAALATLTDNGQGADAAATHLRMTVSLMEAPSNKAAGALAAIGLSSDQLAKDMQTKGLIPALEDLKKHLLDTYGTTADGKVKIAQTLTEAFGGGRSSAAIQTLIDQLDRVKNKEQQIGDQAGEFSKKVLEQASTPAAQFKMASDAMNADLIKLGSDLLPMVVTGVHDLTKAVNGVTTWFDHLDKSQQNVVLDIVAAFAIGGPVLLAFGTFAKSISSIIDLATGPFGQAMVRMAGFALTAADQMIGYMTGTAGVQAAVSSLSAYVGGPAALAGWGALAAGAVADLFLIVKAVQTVQGALSALSAAKESAQSYAEAKASTHAELLNLQARGTADQKARANKLLSEGYASGTNYARGGWSIVGENGPERMYVPRGSQILTNGQSGMMNDNSTTTVSIGQIVLPSASSVTEFFRQLNQDTLNIGKGLTTNMGVHP